MVLRMLAAEAYERLYILVAIPFLFECIYPTVKSDKLRLV
jgi:hypothetical protein